VGGWLAQAAGVGRCGRGVGRSSGARPVIGAGEVALWRGFGVEDDVRDFAGLPLMVEKREKFPGGAACIEVCKPYGDEAGVPAPLVRIEVRGRPRPPPHVVVVEDFLCSCGQRFAPHKYASWEVLYLHYLISFWLADPFLGCARMPPWGSSPLEAAES
jgi:hypothetical protein